MGPAGTVPHLLAFKGPLRPPCLANFSVASVLPNSPSLGNSQGQNYTSSFLEVKVYKVKFLQEVKVKVTQSCPTLCDPMDCIVHGILQARILEWVTFPFSTGSFYPRDTNPGLPGCRWILYQLSHKGSPRILEWVAYPFSSESSRPRN